MKQRISFQDLPAGYFDVLMKTGFYVKKSGLDLKLLELLNYRVSQINGCGVCLDIHHKDLIVMGETEQRLYSLPAWKECPYYDEKERAVLAYAEALTQAHDADDEVFEALSAFFSKAQIAYITLAVTMINTWNTINKSFRTIPGGYTPGQYDEK
jgi:AhpD family alkylhydroperoxidase